MPKFIRKLGTKLPPNGKPSQRKRKCLVQCYTCDRTYELNQQDYDRNPEGTKCVKCRGTKYTDKEIELEALTYKFRNEFQVGSPWAYKAAFRRGILNSVCSHMESKYTDTSILDSVKKTPGIYLLYHDDKIVYVGKSEVGIGGRIINHKSEREGAKVFEKAVCYEVRNKTDMHVAEVYLINKYKPAYNVDALSDEPLTLSIDNLDSIILSTTIIKDIPLVF